MVFHVSLSELNVGQVLDAGSWGVKIRTVKRGGPMLNDPVTYAWEMGLETARIAIDADLPSRLSSIFLAERQAFAFVFRDQYRAGGRVYEVERLDDAREHRGDFGLLSGNLADEPYIDTHPQRCVDYWTKEPELACEIVYSGRVRVLREVVWDRNA